MPHLLFHYALASIPCQLRLHPKPRFNACLSQRFGLPCIKLLLLCLLCCCQSADFLHRRELDTSGYVFSIKVHSGTDGDVLASYRHEPGQLDVVYQPSGCCWVGGLRCFGVAGCYSLIAFCEDEVGYVVSAAAGVGRGGATHRTGRMSAGCQYIPSRRGATRRPSLQLRQSSMSSHVVVQGARTVDHVQEHRRSQEGLWREIDGQDLLRRSSCSAEHIRSCLWGRGSIVYASVSCPSASVFWR
jgi:hypothetical protein